MRILIVEDDLSVAKGISYRLQDRGHTTDVLHDGTDADSYLRGDENDVVVLDITLPGLDGLRVLRNMRQRGDTRPVLLLTALSDTHDRVAGLDAGADDYLVKPFEMDELEARLRALSRRKDKTIRLEQRFGPLVMDLEARQLFHDGTALDLPRLEAMAIEVLMLAEGRIVPKSRLIESLYGTGADVEESAAEVLISRLRKRIRRYGVDIRAQRGLGYHLVETTTS